MIVIFKVPMIKAQIPYSGEEPVGFHVPDKKNLENGTRKESNRLS